MLFYSLLLLYILGAINMYFLIRIIENADVNKWHGHPISILIICAVWPLIVLLVTILSISKR
jgi:hypothetical protein